MLSTFFFFNDTATTEIYTLSLHDALPISADTLEMAETRGRRGRGLAAAGGLVCRGRTRHRSEEHTSELQSRLHLVCRLLLEKKKIKKNIDHAERNLTVEKLDWDGRVACNT